MPVLARLVEGLFGAPWSPCSSTDTGGSVLLLLRFALLGGVVSAALVAGDAPGRRAIALSGALLVGSLAFRGLLPPYVAVALFGAARARAPRFAALAGVALALALVAASPGPPSLDNPLEQTPGRDPALETARWAARDNAFLARAWAARWAEREARPGPGHFALAQASWALGHKEQARQLASGVSQGASDPSLRDRASAQVRAWEQAP